MSIASFLQTPKLLWIKMENPLCRVCTVPKFLATFLTTCSTDYQWKYEFCTEILAQALELTLTAEPPKYEVVLDLDRKVREKRVPPHLNVFMNVEDCTPATYMRGCMLGQYRAVSMCLLLVSLVYSSNIVCGSPPLSTPQLLRTGDARSPCQSSAEPVRSFLFGSL